jgi:hypothetical protein
MDSEKVVDSEVVEDSEEAVADLQEDGSTF